MLWKLLTLAVIVGFAWWRLRQFLRLRKLRERGEPIPSQPQGLRPISLLAGLMLLFYGGYLIFVLAESFLNG
jgi:hypothetical protein